jgi:hypothetical protein
LSATAAARPTRNTGTARGTAGTRRPRHLAFETRHLHLRVGKTENQSPGYQRIAPVIRDLIRIQRCEVCFDNSGELLETAYFFSNFNYLTSRRQFGYGAANSQRIAHGARMIRTRAAPVKEPA